MNIIYSGQFIVRIIDKVSALDSRGDSLWISQCHYDNSNCIRYLIDCTVFECTATGAPLVKLLLRRVAHT